MKAVVLEIKNKRAAILTKDGDILNIKNKQYRIGQAIEYIENESRPAIINLKLKARYVLSAAAAVFILSLTGASTLYALPYGTVTLDSDSSIQYTVNYFDYVIDVKATNAEGKEILDQIEKNTLKHHKIEDAISTTIETMEENGNFENDEQAAEGQAPR